MLLQEIKLGESKVLEFKEKLPSDPKKYVKTVVAFSNCLGGKIVIGVSNANNEIIGIDPELDVFSMMDSIANSIADNCEPQIIPNIYPVTLEGRTVIVVEVVRGSLQPYFIKSLGKDHGTYIRIGATSHPADTIYLSEMELKRRNISFDSLPCEKFEVTDELARKCCDIIYESKLYHEPRLVNRASIKRVQPQNLVNWKLLIDENGKFTASNAFALLMQEDDSYFDNSRVQCAVFKGTTRSHFIDKKEYYGSVLELIDLSYDFIIRHINVGLSINGLYSSPDYEIDPFIIRELLNNAFHHRSYIDDGAIQVSIFDDRLEITSPGSIYNNLSVEQIISGRTSSRNKVLTRVFKEMGLIEEWGTGLQRVIDRCRDMYLPDPKFEDLDTAFRVTVFRNNSVKSKENLTELNDISVKDSDKMTESDNISVKDSDKMTELNKKIHHFKEKDQVKVLSVINYLKQNNSITSLETKSLLGVSESTCRRLLTKCVEADILYSKGQTKNKKYYLMKE